MGATKRTKSTKEKCIHRHRRLLFHVCRFRVFRGFFLGSLRVTDDAHLQLCGRFAACSESQGLRFPRMFQGDE